MKRTRNIFLLLVFAGNILFANNGENISPETAKQWMQSQKVSFTENKGQLVDQDGKPVPSMLFQVDAPGMNVYIYEKGLSYYFIRTKTLSKENSFTADLTMPPGFETETKTTMECERIEMELAGATIKKENIVKEGMSSDFSQYFLAHCPDGITDVHSYEKITIKNVYPNIDWILYTTPLPSSPLRSASAEQGGEGQGGGALKYDFIVHPGADPQQIKLVYSSLNPLRLNDNGSVELKTRFGNLIEQAPYSYIKETAKKVESIFKIISQQKSEDIYHTTISFELSNFKLSNFQTLIIDPQLIWSTFYGRQQDERPGDIECDIYGNVFVTGSAPPTFPVFNPGSGAYFQSYQGTLDQFIIKFSNSGQRLWATWYGGTLGEGLTSGICSDSNGNIFITGTTSSTNFPVFNPGNGAYFQATKADSNNKDMFVLKFNNAGVRLWATYYGGNKLDWAYHMACDISGNIFIAGITWSDTLPLFNPGGGAWFQGTYSGGSWDGLILKFNNTGTLLWSTYYGGTDGDVMPCVTTDPSGNVFFAGNTLSANFPVLNPGAPAYFQGTYSGGTNTTDVFILKFSNTGVLLWSTYLGVPGPPTALYEQATGIICDNTGNLFVTGMTGAPNFPLLNPGGGAFFQGTHGGIHDAFITKFSNTGQLLWSTFYGGIGNEGFTGGKSGNLAVDACNNVYVMLGTDTANALGHSLQASCSGGYYDSTYNGRNAYFEKHGDCILLKFNNTGSLLWGSYLGGNGQDFPIAIDLDKSGNLFTCVMAGFDPISNAAYPITNPGGGAWYDNTFGGYLDILMSKFIPPSLNLATASTDAGCNCSGTATVNVTGGCSPYKTLWYDNLWSFIDDSSSLMNLCPDNYNIVAIDTINCVFDTTQVNVTGSGNLSVNMLQSNITCNGSNDGTASIAHTGGVNPYIYSWISSGQTSSTISGLSTGTYTATVTDSTGCVSTKTVSIAEPALIASTVSYTDITCFGFVNGTASVTATGGTGTFTYNWLPSGGTNSMATGLAAGTYTVLVTDVNGCTHTETAIITEPSVLTVSVASTNLICFNSGDGTAMASASGGTGNLTYNWLPSGGTNSSATNLSAGTYSVLITDANGCTQIETTVITAPPAITSSVTSTDAGCNNNGTTTVSASGGSGNLSYVWSVPGETATTITGLSAGTYSVTITDSLGCDTISSVIINQLPGPTAGVNGSVIIRAGSSTTLSASPGTPGVFYLWSPSDGLNCDTCQYPVASPEQNTLYCVTITDSTGCTDSACVSVFIDEECKDIFIPNVFSPNGDGTNDEFNIFGSCVKTFYIAVFNRWGEKVFESNDVSNKWDGTFKGEPLNTDILSYVASIELNNGGEITKKGNIYLLK